jgi:fluoride exporter
MSHLLWIALGAVVGANARYLVGVWAAQRWGMEFPYGTLFVNVTGSFALGFLLAAGTGRLSMTPEMRLMLGVGLLGSYTTFSTFSADTVLLLQHGNFWSGALNIMGNNLLGIISALLGIYCARLLA